MVWILGFWLCLVGGVVVSQFDDQLLDHVLELGGLLPFLDQLLLLLLVLLFQVLDLVLQLLQLQVFRVLLLGYLIKP